MTKFQNVHTENYYDSFSDVYAAIWSNQMHTGYFDREKSLDRACEDMNFYLAKEAGIKPNSVVLNIGCGRGGADRFLIKNFDCKVIGIDISQKQLDEAVMAAQEEGMQDAVKYMKSFMTELTVDDDSIDCIWVQESLFHCHEKDKAISEFYRVLKSGGTVVLEDTVLMDPKAKKEVMDAFGKRVKINDIFTPNDYEKLFGEKGFKLAKKEDMTKHLEKTYVEIAKFVSENQDKLKKKIDEKNWSSLDNSGREQTLKYVRDGKLGCVAMYFTKA